MNDTTNVLWAMVPRTDNHQLSENAAATIAQPRKAAATRAARSPLTTRSPNASSPGRTAVSTTAIRGAQNQVWKNGVYAHITMSAAKHMSTSSVVRP